MSCSMFIRLSVYCVLAMMSCSMFIRLSMYCVLAMMSCSMFIRLSMYCVLVMMSCSMFIRLSVYCVLAMMCCSMFFCSHNSRGRLSDLVAEHLDHLHYLNDILSLDISALNEVLTEHLINRLLVPLYVYSLDNQPRHGANRVCWLLTQFCVYLFCNFHGKICCLGQSINYLTLFYLHNM